MYKVLIWLASTNKRSLNSLIVCQNCIKNNKHLLGFRKKGQQKTILYEEITNGISVDQRRVLSFYLKTKMKFIMANVIKNLFYTSVGFTALVTEKVQDLVDDLVKQRKISREEGKKIVDEFWQDTETRKEEVEDRLSKTVENVVSRFDFLTGKDVEDLRERVEELEVKVKAATAKKKTTRKSTKATSAAK